MLDVNAATATRPPMAGGSGRLTASSFFESINRLIGTKRISGTLEMISGVMSATAAPMTISLRLDRLATPAVTELWVMRLDKMVIQGTGACCLSSADRAWRVSPDGRTSLLSMSVNEAWREPNPLTRSGGNPLLQAQRNRPSYPLARA